MFDTSLAVQSAPEGKDFVMKCIARGHSGQPKLIWRIDYRAPQGRGLLNINNSVNLYPKS
jgi:hypothetical protein